MMGKSRFILIMCLVLPASGDPSFAAMTDTALRDNIGIQEITGGDRANHRWKSEIGNHEFRRALKSSLESAGLLERATGEGRYSLNAVLESLDQPDVGLTVMTRVKYTLIDRNSGKEIYQESVSGEYAMEMWDCILRTGRLRVASEGAARANTKQLTERLSQLFYSQEQASLLQQHE